MREKPPVIAILCADLHLSDRPPIARAGEPDWYHAMARPLRQLSRIQQQESWPGTVPILCAGDVFDYWRSVPGLINFAVHNLPGDTYAIPGQHDLPFHDLEEIKRSAYRTLAHTPVLVDLSRYRHPHPFLLNNTLALHGFSWGQPFLPLQEKLKGFIHVAIVHSFVWIKGRSYKGAPQTGRLRALRETIKSYDVVVFGDNHQGFKARCGGTPVFNCGSFMRRCSDEINYRPRVGLLRGDKSIETVFLDTSKEVIGEGTKNAFVPQEGGFEALLAEVDETAETAVDFVQWLQRAAEETSRPGVRKVILEAIEQERKKRG